MEREFKPFDIVKLSNSYIEELRSRPRFSFPIDILLEWKESSTGSSHEKIDYENIVGIITETGGLEASVDWFNATGVSVKNAWFSLEELEIIGNAMVSICNSMAHPFGSHTDQGEYFYGNRAQENHGEQE